MRRAQEGRVTMANLMIRVAVGLACIAAAATATADESFRCGSRIIKTGMTRTEVRQYCGAPAAEDVEIQDVRSGNQVVGKTTVYRWTYKFAGAERLLEFDEDTLKSIESR